MILEKTKVQKIIDEIFIYLQHMGAENITINYKENPDSFAIDFVSDYAAAKEYMIKTLNKYLCVARQAEMESYYWELAGMYSDDTGLALIGMMTDEVDISYENGTLEIKILRLK